MKITDTGYFLPQVQALEGFDIFGQGATKPMLIRGICTTTYEKGDYVVKYIRSQRMSEQSSCRELIAAFIALELELNVAQPVIVIVTPDFVDTLRGKDGFKVAENSVGQNFGCTYVAGMKIFLKDQPLTQAQFEQAQQIFPLDIFIANADRNNDKQNMLTDGEKILIFDHELAFGFVFDLIQNPQPWILSDNDEKWIQKHFFYSEMQNGQPEFELFINKLDALNDNFWEKVNVLIPEAWKTGQIETIKNNLSELVAHKADLLQEIYKIVS